MKAEEQKMFVLDSSVRERAYAFLAQNPEFNNEDVQATLYDAVTSTVLLWSRDKDPVTKIVVSAGVYNRFMAESKLIAMVEPVQSIKDLQEGKFGYLLDATLYTEAYKHPVDQTMGPKELLFQTLSDRWIRISFRN